MVKQSGNLLVVDDNKINRTVATTMLQLYNFYIDEADSGSVAIELAKENKYDMILAHIFCMC